MTQKTNEVKLRMQNLKADQAEAKHENRSRSLYKKRHEELQENRTALVIKPKQSEETKELKIDQI